MKTLVLPACSGSHLSPHQSLPLVCPPGSELISIRDCMRRQLRTSDRDTVRMTVVMVTAVKLTLTMTVVTLTLTLATAPMLTALVVILGALIVSDC